MRLNLGNLPEFLCRVHARHGSLRAPMFIESDCVNLPLMLRRREPCVPIHPHALFFPFPSRPTLAAVSSTHASRRERCRLISRHSAHTAWRYWECYYGVVRGSDTGMVRSLLSYLVHFLRGDVGAAWYRAGGGDAGGREDEEPQSRVHARSSFMLPPPALRYAL
jgi:hypothetical protein